MSVLNVSVNKTRLANQLTTFTYCTLLTTKEEVKPLLYKYLLIPECAFYQLK